MGNIISTHKKIKLNYRLDSNELVLLKDHLTATNGIAFKERGLSHYGVDIDSLPTGLSSKFTPTEQSRLIKSLVNLLTKLTRSASVRSVKNELQLFNLPESGCYRAICMLERIRLAYGSTGFPFPYLSAKTVRVEKDLYKYTKLLLEWCVLYSCGIAEKIAKYQSVSMFNKVMNVEPLEPIELPFGWCLGSLTPYGKMHNHVQRTMIKSSLGEKLRLAQCFLYFKKGCPPASKSFIDETLKKHLQAMTKPAPPVDDVCVKTDVTTLVIPRAAIKQRIGRVVYEVFKNYREPEKFWEPSRSASYHKSRPKGGQMSEVDFFAPGWSLQFTKTGWQYLPSYGSDNWEFFDTGYSFIKVPKVVFPRSCVTKGIYAKPIALTEPLKVRVITCENAWSTYMLTGAQKSLWECLHNHHWFALTGRPVDSSDIPVDPQKEWNSVDYSAATDNLSSEFSRLVIREICDLTGLPFQLCYDSLCNHKVDYKKQGWGEVFQTNGQLMGSILSFIVLCICNAVVISLSVNPGTFDPNISILVNGDDGLFLGGEVEYETWKVLSSHVGLTPSIGKVYRSKEFCVIDSTCYYRSEDGLVLECPYPNASGMMQFDARTYTDPKTPLELKDSLCLWMKGFDTASVATRKQAETLWYSTFDSILKTDWVESYRVNWYLPQNLGGLGLPLRINSGLRDELSREVLTRAKWCLDNKSAPWRQRVSKGDYSYLMNDFVDEEIDPIEDYDSVVDLEEELGSDDYICPKFSNPFKESPTWMKVSSTRPLTDKVYHDLAAIGWSKPVEVTERPIDDSISKFLLKRHEGGSSVSVCLLNNLDMQVASGVRNTRYYDFCSDLQQFRKPQKLQRYWDNYSEEVHAESFQFLSFECGSRKLRTWGPKIPEFDPLLGKNYCRMLEILDAHRTLLPVSGSLVESQNPYCSDTI